MPDVAPPVYRLDEPSHILLAPVIAVGVGVIVAVVVDTADLHKLCTSALLSTVTLYTGLLPIELKPVTVGLADVVDENVPNPDQV